jgi:VWFA-related protein
MAVKRISAILVLALCASAQTPREKTTQADATPRPDFTTTVTDIVVPVTVRDRDGNIVNGLQPRNFHLYDNDKEQEIAVDVNYHPVSLVIAIQANSSSEQVLPQVKRIGSMLESVVVGDQGEAAVLAFDHRFQVKQEFTSDLAQITEAMKKITSGSTGSRLVDAMDYGVRMLRNRPSNRRRVLLVLSETRDRGSEGKLREAVLAAQLQNVTVYTVNMSRMIGTLSEKAQPPRMDPLPPATRSMPSNVPATPNSVMQKGTQPGTNLNIVPLLVELFKDTKAVFIDNPAEAMTKATGGQEYSFFKQRGLEEAVEKIGAEIHSQYIITYNPNNKGEGGFHEIKVTLDPQKDYRVHNRPGYWMASVY